MASTQAERKAQLVNKVVAELEHRLPAEAATLATGFARDYYHQVFADDVLDRSPSELYGALLAHFNLFRRRAPKQALVRVYNPQFDRDGWQGTHTAIEIVCDDMPFLVDSVVMVFNRHNLTVHSIFHPVLHVTRDEDGTLLAVGEAQCQRESVIQCQIDRQSEASQLEALADELRHVLENVTVAVADWQPMRQRMDTIIETLQHSVPTDHASGQEVIAFLRWVAEDHFTFLGYREYRLVNQDEETLLLTRARSGLGILRDEEAEDHISPSFAELPPELRSLAWAPELLTISKSSAYSTVHRPSHLDYIGIKIFDQEGGVCGEHRFLGLYTSQAYSQPPHSIPLLRQKVSCVLERSELYQGGHAYRALQHILHTFPRDDLFQASDDELAHMAMGILQLQERQRLRLFLRADRYQRFVSCLIYVPRERYNTELRLRMEQVLMSAFNGTSVSFTTQFSESVLARVQLHIRTPPGHIPDVSVDELEGRLVDAMLAWSDALRQLLLDSEGESRGMALYHRYERAFSPAYQGDFDARAAIGDVLRFERVLGGEPLVLHLYRPIEEPEGPLRFKLFGRDQPLSLSSVLPILERLGLTVLSARPYRVTLREGQPLWMVEFVMLGDAAQTHDDLAEVRDIFQDAFLRIWTQEMGNDALNRLVLSARIPWRDVVVLRAYSRYMQQIRVPFSQDYIQQTLVAHPRLASLLVALFHARFDPEQTQREASVQGMAEQLTAALDEVSSLDEDRILRRLLALIEATLRTNFYQCNREGERHGYVSFTYDPSGIPELPRPRPMYEIFVYSTRVEAVHLRGGPVARGGLRWSDRREDFRTEILGLMKAQMVKNSVIVPVGSKGGFVVKRPPSDRAALQAEVEACYRTFISGMLDITDNRVQQRIVPPPQVVRYDGDDPYLVVAADKGTATFSDLANAVSAEYDFWLGDAFASGGANGYDHKKMGITARGAWESVKRHFRELGLDIQQRDDFTVVGIGDMSGDVFGNGMLLSEHIRLVAAFNHLHIFIDPDPDAATSYRERQRLFEMGRSSWLDYDSNLISPGGGVFARSAKSIALSSELQRLIDSDREEMTPNELINALLRASVDLLWNGGIGTYVKAHDESHDEVGDRTNDVLRVDARQLRCRVIGEGGNLGLTQRARIEAAQHGVHLLTDSIDNSAGVNCSDHEVNIKILLDQAVRDGELTLRQRNRLLAEMTDEVAALVLRQNYLQPQALSMSHHRAAHLLEEQGRVMRQLERQGKLDRALEDLPDDEALAERAAAGQGLTPPELAVLLAYSKIDLFNALIDSDVPEDPYLRRELMVYFPTRLCEAFSALMDCHPLRREIIVTYITNSVLNRMGSTFVHRLREESGAETTAIARAYTAAREMFQARSIWRLIEGLDNQVAATCQIEMQLEVRHLLQHVSLWLLRNRRAALEIEALVEQYRSGIASLVEALPRLMRDEVAEHMHMRRDGLIEQGVPEALASQVTSLPSLFPALDIIEVAQQQELPAVAVADVYFALGSAFRLPWIQRCIRSLQVDNHWQGMAQNALLNRLYELARHLCAEVLIDTNATDTSEQRLQQWLERNEANVQRYHAMCSDFGNIEKPDLAMLSVALGELGTLTRSGS